MRTIGTHIDSIVWKWATQRSEVFTFYARIGVKSFAVDAMLSGRIVSNTLVSTMAAQFVGFIYPPTVTMFRIVARVIIRTTTYFTYSVSHN